ncbi:hypothetical protein AAMO2058_001124100 [Amorphochlora amoebiformis]
MQALPRRSFSSSSLSSIRSRFWKWTTQPRPSWRESGKEAGVLFIVFGITGTASVTLVRPALKYTLGLEGSLKDGPWSYRIGSLLLVSPVYACMLLGIGTLAGRHNFAAKMFKRIMGRFLPASVTSALVCPQGAARAASSRSRGSLRAAADGSAQPVNPIGKTRHAHVETDWFSLHVTTRCEAFAGCGIHPGCAIYVAWMSILQGCC